MKKIIVTTHVRDESDIIESFCRYNLTYCDGMIIYERESSDNTNEIIRKLVAEGLPIYLYDDPDIVKPEIENIMVYRSPKNSMAHRAIDEYGADLVIPLDADEFLCHTDGINPREALDAMCEDTEYQLLWRFYVYEHEPDIELGFMPNNFTHYRNKEFEGWYIENFSGKTIVSKYLLKEKQAIILSGGHRIVYPDEYISPNANIEVHDKLVLAHFPVRSRTQIMNKATLWLTQWRLYGGSFCVENRELIDTGFVGCNVYIELMNTGELTPESIRQYSIDYHMVTNEYDDTKKAMQQRALTKEEIEKLRSNAGAELTIFGPMDISFCRDKLALRYTDYNEASFNRHFLRTLLKDVELTVTKLASEHCELEQRANQLQEAKDRLEKECIEYKEARDWLENEYIKYTEHHEKRLLRRAYDKLRRIVSKIIRRMGICIHNILLLV